MSSGDPMGGWIARLLAIGLVCAPLAARAVEASPESEIAAIQSQLNLIQQQQQSLFQQFQMLQELRRLTLQSDVQTISYDDRLRARQERDDRADRIASELAERYRMHRDLEEQKQPLLQRLNELSRQP